MKLYDKNNYSFYCTFCQALFGCKGQQIDQTEEIALGNTKIEQDLGYSISYPADWDYIRHPNNSVVIKGKESTPAALTIIQIQSYPKKADGGPYENAAASYKPYLDIAEAVLNSW